MVSTPNGHQTAQPPVTKGQVAARPHACPPAIRPLQPPCPAVRRVSSARGRRQLPFAPEAHGHSQKSRNCPRAASTQGPSQDLLARRSPCWWSPCCTRTRRRSPWPGDTLRVVHRGYRKDSPRSCAEPGAHGPLLRPGADGGQARRQLLHPGRRAGDAGDGAAGTSRKRAS